MRKAYVDRDLSFEQDGVRVNVLKINAPANGKLIEDAFVEEFGENIFRYLTEWDSDFDSGADYVVDFSGINFTSSAVYAKLIVFDKKHRKHRNGNPLTLINLCAGDIETLELIRLNRLFEIYHDLNDYKRKRFGVVA